MCSCVWFRPIMFSLWIRVRHMISRYILSMRSCSKHGAQEIKDYYYRKGRDSYECKKCHKESMKKHEIANKDKVSARKKKAHNQRRLKVLSHYSGGTPFCACCKESALEFLALDHIAGGGAKHRLAIKTHNMYVWVVQNNYPPIFRVLCHNCNTSLGHYGYCPHQAPIPTA